MQQNLHEKLSSNIRQFSRFNQTELLNKNKSTDNLKINSLTFTHRPPHPERNSLSHTRNPQISASIQTHKIPHQIQNVYPPNFFTLFFSYLYSDHDQLVLHRRHFIISICHLDPSVHFLSIYFIGFSVCDFLILVCWMRMKPIENLVESMIQNKAVCSTSN